MRVLLDTHVFVWWLVDDVRLSDESRRVLADTANELFLSVASAYEIAVKAARGRLTLPEPVETYLPSRLRATRCASLDIGLGHVVRAGSLPDIHRDPWDRLLVAQGQIEGLPIVTGDPVIARYDVDVIW